MKKIRTDFVTNSSSTCYIVLLRKKGTDDEILKELEELSGYGPKGAKLIFDSMEEPFDPEELDEEFRGKDTMQVVVTTSDSESCDGPDVASALCGELLDEDYPGKALEILDVGEDECC